MSACWFRMTLLLMLVALCAPLVQADPITGNDPRIIINDPPHPNCTSVTSVVGTTFTFSADATGQGFLCFTNDSGTPWYNISINVPLPVGPTFPDEFTCASDVFATCVFTLLGGNIVNIFFTDGALPDDGTNFNIDLASDSPNGWGPNASFTAIANVPEPGTISLFAFGLGALAARKRIRRITGA